MSISFQSLIYGQRILLLLSLLDAVTGISPYAGHHAADHRIFERDTKQKKKWLCR